MKQFFQTYYKKLSNMDKAISKIMKNGIYFSFLISVLGVCALMMYKGFYISHHLYDAALILFQAGSLFAVQFFVCGITMDTVKNLNS